MKKILIPLLKFYQWMRRNFGRNSYCVFYPSCSDYYLSAVAKYGALRGSLLGAGRILRCHPWQEPRVDFLE